MNGVSWGGRNRHALNEIGVRDHLASTPDISSSTFQSSTLVDFTAQVMGSRQSLHAWYCVRLGGPYRPLSAAQPYLGTTA